MSIICISRSGIRQPTEKQLRSLFEHNPHGAGYMYARAGVVTIHKGFMDVGSLLEALKSERFTEKDCVVYHFRFSKTGIAPEMTHPFPLTHQRAWMRELDLDCPCGVAQDEPARPILNPAGRDYSDAAAFITERLADMVHKSSDLRNKVLLTRIYRMTQSKFAIMDGDGYVATSGEFVIDHGLLFSGNPSETPSRL